MEKAQRKKIEVKSADKRLRGKAKETGFIFTAYFFVKKFRNFLE